MSTSMRLALFLCLAGAQAACVPPSYRPTEAQFAEHVRWLADDARAGREPGTRGFEQALAYVIERFEAAGLEPLGDDGGWIQEFDATGRRQLVDGNRLRIGEAQLALEGDWTPFSSAPSGELEAPLAFVGYGLVDPGDEAKGLGPWDDYAGLDVSGRVVVALRRGPTPRGAAEGTGRWLDGASQQYVTTSAKINQAYKHGAAGIIIVNDGRAYGPDGDKDDEPVFYKGVTSGAVSSLPAVSVTWAAGSAAFEAMGLNLFNEQMGLDHGLRPRSRLIDDASTSMTLASEFEVVPTWNVVGRLRGSDTSTGDEYVLVGAHLDHLGVGLRSGSMGGPEAAGQIHNGADDNASGSAGLLEIARSLSARPNKPRRSIVFVAFGAEEWGLLGSRHYVEHPTVPLDQCVAMVNMDMIGRSADGRVEVGGMGTAEVIPGLLDLALDEVGTLHEVRSPSVVPNTDHAPFFEAKIPVVSFFTGLHSQYHTPEDDAELIDAAFGADIAALAGSMARRLADLPARPVFTEPVEEKSQEANVGPHDGQEVIGYGVSFGSSPDMTYTAEDGVLIGGVRADSPAERCGLVKGDLLIALDGTPIRNLEDYSVLLFSHRPGDEITVTVMRDGEEVVLTARLEARAGDT